MEQFARVLRHALETPRTLNQREWLALDLFNGSFFQESIDTRFLLLMMALEALIDQPKRSEAAIRFLDSVIQDIKLLDDVISDEKDSLVSSMAFLKKESIGQTGKKLVQIKLEGREYAGHSPEKFFSLCYRLRSQLVHGAVPYPTLDQVNSVVATLECFVSDLISGPLIHARKT